MSREWPTGSAEGLRKETKPVKLTVKKRFQLFVVIKGAMEHSPRIGLFTLESGSKVAALLFR